MICKNWRENRIVLKIKQLQKDYQFNHFYSGISSWGDCNIESLYECDCCENLVGALSCIYHKTDNKQIGVCSNCLLLWTKISEEESRLKVTITKT